MSDLLSAQDYNSINSAIQDVTDTFFKVDVVLKKKSRNYTAFNEVKSSITSNTDYSLKGLVVYDKGKNERKDIGSMDLHEGIMYFNYMDLNALSLIDSAGNPKINSNIDEMTTFGETYLLTGHEMVGPFQQRFALVKVYFKKQIKTNT